MFDEKGPLILKSHFLLLRKYTAQEDKWKLKALWDRFYDHMKLAANLLHNQINQKLKAPFTISTSDLQPFGGPNYSLRC